MVDTLRGASAEMQAAVQADRMKPIHLVAITLDVPSLEFVLRLTSATKNVSYGGYTYLSTGTFLGVGEIEESRQLRVHNAVVSLSGLDPLSLALFLGYSYNDQLLQVWRGYLNTTTDVLIVDPIEVFNGRIATVTFNENPDTGKAAIQVEAADHWSDFERRPGRHTNDAEQRLHYPGDAGMEYAGEVRPDMEWGR